MFRFLNVFFRYSLIFLAIFVWVRFFVKNLYLAILYSTLLSCFVDLVIHFLLSKKLEKKTLKKTEQIKMESYFQKLILLPQKDCVKFFNKICKKSFETKVFTNYLQIQHKDYSNVLYPFMSYDKLTKQDIVNIIKKTNAVQKKRLIIPCYDFQKDCVDFVKGMENFEILILDKFRTYQNLMTKYNQFPEINEKKCAKTHKNYKKLLIFMFSRDKIKHYLFTSFFIFVSSFFVRYNIYYVIMSSLLLIFAFISFIVPMYTKKPNTEIL